MVEHALAAAAKGLRVFPLKPNGKTPLVKGFSERATTDAGKIERWWKTYPNANIGISTEGLAVIDVDEKNGKKGLLTLRRLMLFNKFPRTLFHCTPTGGQHYIYRASSPCANTVEKLGSGVDTRGQGGYIVGPGSKVEAGEYTVINEGCGIAEAPEWLVSSISASASLSSKKERPSNEPVVVVDQEVATQRAKEYLASLEEAPNGRRNDGLYKAACRLHGLGLSFDNSFALLEAEWKVEGELGETEFHRTVVSAWECAQNPAGGETPQADFAELIAANKDTEEPPGNEEKPEEEKKKRAFVFERHRDLDESSIDRHRWLIRGWLPSHGLAVLYGKPGTGKSFLALDFARHVAKGEQWRKEPVEQGAVLYFAAEDPHGIKLRVVEQKKRFQEKDIPFYVVSGMFDFVNCKAKDLVGLKEQIGEAEKEVGCPVKLIIIDTLNRSFGGRDENSSSDMSMYLERMNVLSRMTNALVMVVHHPGKAEDRGPRGHSSLFGAADTAIEVRRGEAVLTKQKNGPDGLEFHFRLEDGVLTKTSGDFAELVDALPPRAKLLLDTLQGMVEDCDGDDAVTTKELRSEYYLVYEGSSPGAKRTAFIESVKELRRRRLIELSGSKIKLVRKPTVEVDMGEGKNDRANEN